MPHSIGRAPASDLFIHQPTANILHLAREARASAPEPSGVENAGLHGRAGGRAPRDIGRSAASAIRHQSSAIGRIAASAAFALSCVSAFAVGEFSINSTAAVIQNFDSLGTSGNATLPTGWLMSAAGGGNSSTWATANQTAVSQQASSGTPTAGGRYNWGSNATDRAIGFMTSGGYASPNSILYGITNNTGGIVTSIDIAFDYERYRINTAAASVAFSYSPNGTTWTAFASGDSGEFATGNNSYTFGNGTVVSRSFTLSDLNLADSANFYFRWNFNTTGSNSQGIGLDNVSLTLNSGGGPATFTTWTGTGSPGTWSNGTAGQFGGNYANDLANTVTFAGTGSTVTASGTPQAGSLVFNSDGYTLAGAVQLGVGNITTTGSITTTLSANISGNGSSGLAKLGAGTLILSGSNSYTGSTSISTGVLEARHANALGTSDAGTTVSEGATLALSNSIAIGAEALTLSGNGSGSSGALRNLSGTNSISGAVTLAANTRIQSDAGTLTLTGGITGTGRALTIAGAGATTLSSSGLNTSTAGSLIKTDAGTLTIDASSSYTGGTSVTGGTITASHNSALGTGAVTITSGTVQASNGITLGNDFTIGAPGAGSTLYSQNFNAIASGLPTGWTITTGANATVTGTNQALTTGATDWNNSSGAFKNFASATGLTSSSNSAAQSASADRALGVRPTGSFGDPGAAFNYAFSTTGQTVGSLSLDLMMLDVQGRSNTWSIQYGIGASPASFTTLGTWTDPATWGTTPLTFTTADFGTNLDNQADIVFRVVTLSTSTGSGSRDSIAIDNFVLNSPGGPGTGSATLGLNTAGSASYSGNLTIHGAATLTAASSATATFSGNFSGSGNVTKTGLGTVLLTGQANHSGGTTVSAGTLRVDGFHASAVTVSTGATLGGNGTISGLTTLNSGASLTPGNSVGSLNFNGGLTLQAGSTVTMEIDSASTYDTITVSSAPLTYGGTLSLVFAGGYTPAVNSTYTLFTGASVATATGDFASLSFNNPEYQGTYSPTSGVLTLTAVPEPKTWALLGLGASFLLWQIRRRKKI